MPQGLDKLRSPPTPGLIVLDISFHDYGGHHGDEGDQQEGEQHLKFVVHDAPMTL